MVYASVNGESEAYRKQFSGNSIPKQIPQGSNNQNKLFISVRMVAVL